MFRLSWAITLSFTIALLAGILILTRDLSITSDIFKDGVAQAETVDHTTDTALATAAQLPPADQAINQSMPQVVGVLDSLTRANQTLGTLGDHLNALGQALAAADPSLVGIIGAGNTATDQANAAAAPAAGIVQTLADANTKARALGLQLDRSLALSHTIDSKLRIALILPTIGK
jgi:hypothetical protein